MKHIQENPWWSHDTGGGRKTVADGGCDVEWTDEHNVAPRVGPVADENHVWLRVEGRESAMGTLSTKIKVKNAQIDID